MRFAARVADDMVVDLPDCKVPTAVPLRTIVRQFTSLGHARTVPVTRVYLVLGRLRSLDYAIAKYNEGLRDPLDAAFQCYWRHRALDLLSGFGFHVHDARQEVHVAGLAELIVEIEALYSDEIRAARQMIDNGLITFDGLSELYRPDVPVVGKTTLGKTQQFSWSLTCFMKNAAHS